MIFNETVYIIQQDDYVFSCDDEFIDSKQLTEHWTYCVYFDLWTKEQVCRPRHLVNFQLHAYDIPRNWTHG